jgi:tetratricopeptide (TPR) repeat protein
MPFKKTLLTARDLANNGKYQEALQHYTILYKKDPHDKEVQEAIQKLESKLAPPKTLKEKLEILVKHYTSGELKEAISYGNLLIEDYPKDAIVLTILGAANNDLGNLEKAAEKFTKICVLQPNNFEAHNNLGKVLVESEKYLDAVPYLKKAIEINPKSAQAHENLASALKNLGKIHEAKGHYKEAINIEPNFWEAHANLGTMLCEVQFKKTIVSEGLKHIKTAILLNKKSFTVNSNLLFALNYDPDLTAEEIYNSYKEYDKKIWQF